VKSTSIEVGGGSKTLSNSVIKIEALEFLRSYSMADCDWARRADQRVKSVWRAEDSNSWKASGKPLQRRLRLVGYWARRASVYVKSTGWMDGWTRVGGGNLE
jgi:hypothetical protein